VPASRRAALRELRSPFRFLDASDRRVLVFVLGIKVLLFGFGVAVMHAASNRALNPTENAFSIWNGWDAPAYLSLAEHGYQSTGDFRFLLVFFPLFPWLVRLLAPVCGGYAAAALWLSTVASLVLAVLLRRLAALDDPDLGESTVFFLFVFPTAYFLHIGYTESLFLALTLGAFLAARQRRWRLAGALGAFAGLARINAVVLVPALAAEAFLEYRRERRWRTDWLWLTLPLLGLAAYLLLNETVGGHPLRFLDYQAEHWQRHFAWPWTAMQEGGARWFGYRRPALADKLGFDELLFALIGLVACVMSWRRQRVSYAVWTTGTWLIFSCQSYLMSVPRYTLMLFPMFMLLARLARSRTIGALVAVWSLLFFALFASEFVQGRWAF
jgi:hypothetical protein